MNGGTCGTGPYGTGPYGTGPYGTGSHGTGPFGTGSFSAGQSRVGPSGSSLSGGGRSTRDAVPGGTVPGPSLAASAVRLPSAARGLEPETATATASATAPPSPSSPTSPTTVLVIAKEPVPGRVKTRLTPPYRPEEAARLAEAALADTLETVARLRVRRRVLVLAGRPGSWLPDGLEVVPQCDGGLDERIAAAFALCDGPALLIGMDTPQITPELLAPAREPDAWDEYDACFGPAEDGGFWALGMACPKPELVLGVPMSRPDTGALQRRRLVEAGLAVRDLPVLRDVDTAADAASAAALTSGRFASVHAELAQARAVTP